MRRQALSILLLIAGFCWLPEYASWLQLVAARWASRPAQPLIRRPRALQRLNRFCPPMRGRMCRPLRLRAVLI